MQCASARRVAALACAVVLLQSFVPVGHALAAGAAGHWADQYLAEAQAAGILAGYPDGTLQPDDGVTRAEFSAMVCRALGEDQNAAAASRMLSLFPDVANSHWAVGYVRIASEAGLVLGDQAGLVHPDDVVSRAEVGAIGSRVLDYMEIQAEMGTQAPFGDDGEIPDWARPGVARLAAAGVILGDENGLFRAQARTTRAEAVTVLLRILEMAGSRWDVAGTVMEVSGESGVVRVKTALADIVVRCDERTDIFVGGRRVSLGEMIAGMSVNVIYQKKTSGTAAVLSAQ